MHKLKRRISLYLIILLRFRKRPFNQQNFLMQTKKKNKFVNKRSVLLTTHQKCFVKKVAICLKKTSNAMKPNEECLLTDIYPSAYINTSRNPMQVHVQLFYLYQCRCTGHSSDVMSGLD